MRKSCAYRGAIIIITYAAASAIRDDLVAPFAEGGIDTGIAGAFAQ
jgi:hypothetical protein